MVAGREEEWGSAQVGFGLPDAAEDSVVIVKRVEQTGGSSAHGGADRLGVEAGDDEGLRNAGLLEMVQDGAKEGFAAEVEQDLVAFLTQVLHTGAQTRRRDES